MKYPIGVTRSNGSKQIAIRFPPNLFKQIIKMAKMEQKNFNVMVLDLVKCGKMCLDESDAMEPKNDTGIR